MNLIIRQLFVPHRIKQCSDSIEFETSRLNKADEFTAVSSIFSLKRTLEKINEKIIDNYAKHVLK